MAWACAYLQMADLTLIHAISSASLPPNREEFLVLDLSCMAWSLSVLAIPHTPLLKAIAARAIRKIREMEALGL